MASTKDVKRTPSGKISYRGETFPGFNKPKRTPGAKKKSAVLAKKGSQIKLFYNDGEYNDWKKTFGTNGPIGWTIKYFKGLGTSTSSEFKDYFANKKIVDFFGNSLILSTI